MAGTVSVRQDRSLLSRCDVLLFRLESLLNLLGGLVIFLIVLLAVANILGRKLFDLPVDGYIDWIEQGMAFFCLFWYRLLPAFGWPYSHGYSSALLARRSTVVF